jgi:hypothetical protein
MEPEKRRFVRKRTDQLLYAELGPDNGSILLNLCEEGCSFQSIAPVRSEQLRFAVSVGDGCKLEGDGRMVWSDATMKTGGLRFLNPSQELQEQVREWLEQTFVTTDGGLVPGADSEAKRRRRKLRREARVAAKLARKQGAVQSGKPETRAESEGRAVKAAIPETTTETTQMISGARVAADLTSRQYRKPVGTWRGASIIALVALLFIAMVSYRRELGHLLMSFGSSMAGEEQKAGTAAPAEVQTVPEQLGIDAKPAALSDRKDTSRGGVEEAEPVSNEQIAPSTSVPAVPAKHDATQQAGASEDVSSLWASVENGDTRAEVVLANRYLRGEGVPQSCAQARVLLEAAVKRGSAEAQQRLDELARGGCP